MPRYRILIVEDEDAQARVLLGYLERFSEESGRQFHVEHTRSALDLLEDHYKYDLIFMDIDLPGITGMEAARQLRSYDPDTQIIFVTNLAQYALHGYEVDALDFMVKPVRYVDFMIRMEKALRVLGRSRDKSLLITMRDGMQVVMTRDLMYADVQDHNLAYHLASGDVVTVRASLNKLQEELAGLSFVRISKSCLVNMRYIDTIAGPKVTLADGSVVYVSRGMRKDVLTAMANYYGGNS